MRMMTIMLAISLLAVALLAGRPISAAAVTPNATEVAVHAPPPQTDGISSSSTTSVDLSTAATPATTIEIHTSVSKSSSSSTSTSSSSTSSSSGGSSIHGVAATDAAPLAVDGGGDADEATQEDADVAGPTADNNGRSGRSFGGESVNSGNSSQINNDVITESTLMSSSTTSTTPAPSRRPTSVDRDKKLMSVLAARRQEQGGKMHLLRAECDRNCTSNFTTRATAGCIYQCVQLYKEESSTTTASSPSYATSSNQNGRTRAAHRHFDSLRSRGRTPLTATSKDPNVIQHLDELLDTEESQTSGLYVNQPRDRYASAAAPSNTSHTKDIANSTTNLGRINYRSNVIENELRQTSTEKVYSKYAGTRIGADGRPKRIEPIPKIAHASANQPIEASVEDTDLVPFHQFGQKLRQTNQRKEPFSQTVGPRKTPLQSMLINSRPSTSKADDEEAIDPLVFKQPSKIRRITPDSQRRNIVALTRRYGGNIPKSALEQPSLGGSLKSSESASSEQINVEKRVHAEPIVLAKPNATATTPLDAINQVENESTSKLLIHVPDPEPVSVTENEVISSSTTSISPEPTTEPQQIPVVTTTLAPVTSSPKPDVTTIPTLPSTTSTSTTSTSTSTPTTTSTTSSTPPSTPAPSVPTKTQVRTLFPIPTPPIGYHPVEETPNLIVFKPINLPPKGFALPTTTPRPTPETPVTQRTFTRTTVSSSVRSTINSRQRPTKSSPTTESTPPSNSNSSIPIDMKILSNLTSYIAKGNFSDEDFKLLAKYFPNMTTKRPYGAGEVLLRDDSEVTIEMHRMNMTTYVLAGLVVFPVVVFLLYLAKTVVFRKSTKSDADHERYIADDLKKISPVVKMEQSTPASVKTSHQPQSIYSDGSIMTEESFNRNLLKFKSLLGEGNFGQVWKAEADDLLGHMGTTRIVAVKTERCGMVNGGLQEEAAIMRKLGSHVNVVTLLGACTTKEPHLLIMEFAMRGRLLSLLRAARGAKSSNGQPTNTDNIHLAPLSPRRLSGFAHDIARGMEYISERKIVHRDLAARNVLLDHNGVCKICDFGMSIDLERTLHLQPSRADLLQHHNSPEPSRFKFDFNRRSIRSGNETKIPSTDCKRPALPIRWMAPEALQYHIFSPETDVWAFGIVLWEIATLGCTPYPSLTGRQVVRNIPNGTRPEIPIDCRPELYELMSRTWRKDPRLRPTFSEARLELSRSLCQWEVEDDPSDYLDISGFSEDLEHGMVYFNRRIPEFECDI